MEKKKLLKKFLSGSKNIRFSEATAVAEAFGFKLDRISGSHHIFVHPDVPELVNMHIPEPHYCPVIYQVA